MAQRTQEIFAFGLYEIGRGSRSRKVVEKKCGAFEKK
jgi:hypothetical protein